MEVGDKQIWLDPTRMHQRGPLSSIYTPDYGYALILKPGTKELIRIQVGKQQHTAETMLERYDVTDFERTGRLDVQARYEGKSANRMRGWFAASGMAEVQRN